MLEYRQRLRVMLSASHGKYDLQKSSIANEINYIYYLTYFHKYSTHPFWEEFNKEFKVEFEGKIKDKVEELRGCIERLEMSHSSLSGTVTNVQTNINSLITSTDTIQKSVDGFIEQLTKYIKQLVEENKQLILNSIKEIEKKLSNMGFLVKCYFDVEFNNFRRKINSSNETIKGNIRKIKTSLCTINVRVCKIMVMYPRISSYFRCNKASEYYGEIIKKLQEHENMLKRLNFDKRKWVIMSETRNKQSTCTVKGETGLHSVTTTTCTTTEFLERTTQTVETQLNPGYFRKEIESVLMQHGEINNSRHSLTRRETYEQIQQYIEDLLKCYRQKKLMSEVEEALKKVYDFITAERISPVIEKLEGILKHSENFKNNLSSITSIHLNSHHPIESFIIYIGKVETSVSSLQTHVLNLCKSIYGIYSCLRCVQLQILTLNVISNRFKNNKQISMYLPRNFETLISSFTKENLLNSFYPVLNSIICIDGQIKRFTYELSSTKKVLEHLKCIEDLNKELKICIQKLSGVKVDFKTITQGLHQFGSQYFETICSIRSTVELLVKNEKMRKHYVKFELQTLNSDLNLIDSQLITLEGSGCKIIDLSQIIYTIEHLNIVICSIKGLKVKNRTVSPQGSESVLGMLKSDQQKLSSYGETLKGIGSDIEKIKPTIGSDYSQFGENLQTILKSYVSIELHNKILDDIKKLEVTKGGDDTINDKLNEFKKKLDGDIEGSLKVIVSNLEEYLTVYKKGNNGNDSDVEGIKDETEVIKKEIESVKKNIEVIDDKGPDLPQLYDSYTTTFADFNKALEDLEHCLDYLIRDFLVCSLCTTICNLKRQFRDTVRECPKTNTKPNTNTNSSSNNNNNTSNSNNTNGKNSSECNCCDSCNTCQTTTLMTDKVIVLQASLHRYVFSLLGHFNAIDTKVFISKLYRCIVRVDDIVRIVQVVDCCCCVKNLEGNNSDKTDRTGKADNSNDTNLAKAHMTTYKDFFNSKNKDQHNPGTLDRLGTPIDIDNNLNHLCLCLAIRYRLYPCMLKTVTLLVQLELGVSGNIARKIGTHSKYNLYYKLSGFDSYNTQGYGCNSHYLSVSMLLVLTTWAMMKLASFIEHRYKIEHDKVKCCTKDKDKCTCKCKKNGQSSDNCCPCCVCHKANGTPSATPATCTASGSGTSSSTTTASTPTNTPKECCCKKTEGSRGCEKVKCKEDNSQSCCCKCCCYCVCENKTQCKCECEPEEHCFCSNYTDEYSEDCYYRWFIYVILYICHLVDHAFSLGYSDIQHAIQLLSNLLSKLDAVCWEADKRCVTLAVKGSGGADTAEAAKPDDTPKQVEASSPPPTTSSTPTIKVKCCLVCLNVKVVCVSSQLVFSVIEVFHKSNVNLKGCINTDWDCICDCKEGKTCLEQIKKVPDNNNTLKCELFSELKQKLDNLKNLNTPKGKWTVNCECNPGTPSCQCKDVSTKFTKVCSPLIDFSKQFFGQDSLKCGCESVIQCCCCCKCDECGTGKSRKCNEKGCGHANGQHGATQSNGQQGTSASPGNGDQAASGNGNNVDKKCPCQEGKDKKEGENCCCNKTDAKSKGCNCTKGEEGKLPSKVCQCCCLSCCADEKNEDEKKKEEKEKPKEEKKEEKKENGKKEGEKNCPCKKKKKKEKPKVHCKDDDNLKDKRCCCKCCPKENGSPPASTQSSPSSATSSPTSNNNNATSTNTTNPEKECCCCCKCKSTCKNGTTAASAGGSGGNGCSCKNGMVQNGEPSGQPNDKCKCYCCFDCDHKKSALKSVCKQLAYDLNSSISVLSKLASNLTIECFESDHFLAYP